MTKKANKKLYGREELKKYFKNGQVPSQNHYEYLLDSVIVQQDDGFSKDEENGFIISPISSSKRLVTFYKNMDRLEPFFHIEKDNLKSPSLKFQPGQLNEDDNADLSSFFFHQDGRLGLGKRSNPAYKADINGFVGMEGRIGNFRSGSVAADGKWHPIVNKLDNCQAFEVMARTGKTGTGKFSILHATALSAYGNSHSKIKKTCAYYGFFWNKLNLRWTGKTREYALELRSNRNYGDDVKIFYNVTKLWDDAFLPDGYSYK